MLLPQGLHRSRGLARWREVLQLYRRSSTVHRPQDFWFKPYLSVARHKGRISLLLTKMNGILGQQSAIQGYTGPGTIRAHEIDFFMNHAPGAG